MTLENLRKSIGKLCHHLGPTTLKDLFANVYKGKQILLPNVEYLGHGIITLLPTT